MASTTQAEFDVQSLSERRRQASRELMRTEILAAAQHIIREKGLDALSLRAIAKAVGVTAPALYEYFDGKDAILRALFLQGSQVMLAGMEQVIAESDVPLLQLQNVLTGYRAFAREEPDYFRLLFGTVDPNMALSETDYAGMQTIFGRFVGVIVSCIEAGDLKPLPPMTLSCSLWATAHGCAMLETESFMANKEKDAEGKSAQFDEAIKLTLLGFATEQGAARIGPVENQS
jgi:AcrR family transcriptional regulator